MRHGNIYNLNNNNNNNNYLNNYLNNIIDYNNNNNINNTNTDSNNNENNIFSYFKNYSKKNSDINFDFVQEHEKCEESFECSICYDECNTCGGNCITLPCDHKFHKGCFKRWFLLNKSCPLCRFDCSGLHLIRSH